MYKAESPVKSFRGASVEHLENNRPTLGVGVDEKALKQCSPNSPSVEFGQQGDVYQRDSVGRTVGVQASDLNTIDNDDMVDSSRMERGIAPPLRFELEPQKGLELFIGKINQRERVGVDGIRHDTKERQVDICSLYLAKPYLHTYRFPCRSESVAGYPQHLEP